jgi:hypothetical protein
MALIGVIRGKNRNIGSAIPSILRRPAIGRKKALVAREQVTESIGLSSSKLRAQPSESGIDLQGVTV